MTSKPSHILGQIEVINKEKSALQNQYTQLQARETRWNLLYQFYRQGLTHPQAMGFVTGDRTRKI